MRSEPITSATITLTPEETDLLRGEYGGTIIAEIERQASDEMWDSLVDAMLHGTPEQRRERTRAQVRANIRANEAG